MTVPAIIGAGAGVIGGVAQGIFNANQAAENRKFQRHMSNTAYRRAVKDMRLAGLNPALAYQRGGASTPGGDSASMGNPGEGVANAVNSAYANKIARFNASTNWMQGVANVHNVMSTAELNSAQANQIKMESQARVAKLLAENKNLAEMWFKLRGEGNLVGIEARRAGMTFEADVEAARQRPAMNKAQMALNSAQAAVANTAARLNELSVPHAENLARAEKSGWKRKVAPFLPDIFGSARSIAPFF